jgi:hypothetical protein
MPGNGGGRARRRNVKCTERRKYIVTGANGLALNRTTRNDLNLEF